MTTTAEWLVARVEERFSRLGHASWPDPHPDLADPRPEEYSRVTDPARYTAVHGRARVWAAVLQEVTGARLDVLDPVLAGEGRRGFARGVRLTPPRADALPLLLLERDVATEPGEAPLAVLDVAVVRTGALVESQPDCGCDACDSGSAQLLEAVDAAVCRVVVGPFVLLRNASWEAQWFPGGGGASGAPSAPDFRTTMRWCERLAEGRPVMLPPGTEAFVGGSWIG